LLSRIELFKTQVKAVLRASVNKNVRFMLPMISDTSELVKSLQIIDDCKDELSDEQIDFDAKMPIGIMIETPSAALMADELAELSDFFSIGTNDLTQYTLAVDRTNELVSDRFDSFNPAVLKLIAMTAAAAARKKIPVGICGELAGHSAATTILVGMGITELSVVPSMVLELKNRIREMKYSTAKKNTSKLLKLPDSYQILKILEQ
jgi:phosphotransferase system enzyme I (PtsI)